MTSEPQLTEMAAKNTDRELWRGPDEGCGDFYADKIFMTESGGLGIDCGGTVFVLPVRKWHALASKHFQEPPPSDEDGKREAQLRERGGIKEEMADCYGPPVLFDDAPNSDRESCPDCGVPLGYVHKLHCARLVQFAPTPPNTATSDEITEADCDFQRAILDVIPQEQRGSDWRRWDRIERAARRTLSPQWPDWRPIESAPKDGTTIDVWIDGEFAGRRTDVSWREPTESEMWVHGGDTLKTSKARWFDPFGPLTEGEITHWLRLPLPPAPRSKEREEGSGQRDNDDRLMSSAVATASSPDAPPPDPQGEEYDLVWYPDGVTCPSCGGDRQDHRYGGIDSSGNCAICKGTGRVKKSAPADTASMEGEENDPRIPIPAPTLQVDMACARTQKERDYWEARHRSTFSKYKAQNKRIAALQASLSWMQRKLEMSNAFGERLDAENERLREALIEIAEWPCRDGGVAASLRDIARAALATPGEKG